MAHTLPFLPARPQTATGSGAGPGGTEVLLRYERPEVLPEAPPRPSRPSSSGLVRSSPRQPLPLDVRATPLPNPQPAATPTQYPDVASVLEASRAATAPPPGPPRRRLVSTASRRRQFAVNAAALRSLVQLGCSAEMSARTLSGRAAFPRTRSARRPQPAPSRLDAAVASVSCGADGRAPLRHPRPVLASFVEQLPRRGNVKPAQMQCSGVPQGEAAILARVVATHPTLTDIDVSGDDLNSVAAKALACAVAANPSVLSARLHGNALTSSDVRAVCAAAATNTAAADHRRRRHVTRTAEQAAETLRKIAREEAGLLRVAEFDARRRIVAEDSEARVFLRECAVRQAIGIRLALQRAEARRVRGEQRMELSYLESGERAKIVEAEVEAAQTLAPAWQAVPRQALCLTEARARQHLRQRERLCWVISKRSEKARMDAEQGQRSDLEAHEAAGRRRIQATDESLRRAFVEAEEAGWKAASDRERSRLDAEAAEELRRQQAALQAEREAKWQKEKERIEAARQEEMRHNDRQRVQKREEDMRRSNVRRREAERCLIAEWHALSLDVSQHWERVARIERALASTMCNATISCDLVLSPDSPTHLVAFFLTQPPVSVAPLRHVRTKVTHPSDLVGLLTDLGRELRAMSREAQQRETKALAALQESLLVPQGRRQRGGMMRADGTSDATRLLESFPALSFRSTFPLTPTQGLAPPESVQERLTTPTGGWVEFDLVKVSDTSGRLDGLECQHEAIDELGVSVTATEQKVRVDLAPGVPMTPADLTRVLQSVTYRYAADEDTEAEDMASPVSAVSPSFGGRRRTASMFGQAFSPRSPTATTPEDKSSKSFERKVVIRAALQFPRVRQSLISSETGLLTTPDCLSDQVEVRMTSTSTIAVLAPYIKRRNQHRAVLFVQGADPDGRAFLAPNIVTLGCPPIVLVRPDCLKFAVGTSFEEGTIIKIAPTQGWTADDEILVRCNAYGDEVVNLLRPFESPPGTPAVGVTLDNRIVLDVVAGVLLPTSGDRSTATPRSPTTGKKDSSVILRVAASLRADVLSRVLSRFRFQNNATAPEEGLRTIVASVTCAAGFTSEAEINIKVKARNLPTELTLPSRRVLYHQQCAAQTLDSLKLHMLRPDAHSSLLFGDAELFDSDTDKLYGGEVIVRLIAGVFRGDQLCLRPTGDHTTAVPDDADERSRFFTARARATPAGTDFVSAGEPTPQGYPMVWMGRIIAWMVTGVPHPTGQCPDAELPEAPEMVLPAGGETAQRRLLRDEAGDNSAHRQMRRRSSTHAFGSARPRLQTIKGNAPTASPQGRRARSGSSLPPTPPGSEAEGRIGKKGPAAGPGRWDQRELKMELTTDGSATVTAVQALLRSLAYCSSVPNPQPGQRSVELVVRLSTDNAPPTESVEAMEFAELRERVDVRVTPPLVEVPPQHQFLDYRERSPPQRVAVFDLCDALSSGVDSYNGGYVHFEFLCGYDASEDVLAFRQGKKDGELTLQQRKSRRESQKGGGRRLLRNTTSPSFNILPSDDGDSTDPLMNTVPLTWEGSSAAAVPVRETATGERTEALLSPVPTVTRVQSSSFSATGSSDPRLGDTARTAEAAAIAPGGELSPASPTRDVVRDAVQSHVADTLLRRRELGAGLTEGIQQLIAAQSTAVLEEKPAPAHLCDVMTFDGRRIAVACVREEKGEISVRFTRKATVSRRDVIAVLKSATFFNRSTDPQEHRKVLRVSVGTGTPSGGWSSALIAVEVTKVNDVTEFVLADPRLRYRPGSFSLNQIGVLPVAPQGRCVLTDPDTDYFDGGMVTAEISVGAVRGDHLSFMTPQQQRTARELLVPSQAELQRRPALASVHEKGQWDGTLILGEDRIVRARDGDGGEEWVVGELHRPDRLTLRLSVNKYDPPRVHILLFSYVVNCIAFSTNTEKLTPGHRMLTLRANDAENPVEGRGRVHIEVHKPLLWCGGPQVDKACRAVGLRGDGVSLLDLPTVSFPQGKDAAKFLTQGFAEICITLPVEGETSVGGYELQLRESTRLRVDTDGVFFGSDFLGRLSVFDSRSFRCDFGWASRASSKAVASMLASFVIKWVPRSGVHKRQTQWDGDPGGRRNSGPPPCVCSVTLSDGTGEPANCVVTIRATG